MDDIGSKEADAFRKIHVEMHSHLPSDPALRVKSLESLLVDKGLLDPTAIDAFIDLFQNRIGPQIGASVVAQAWTDPDFKLALLTDATKALDEGGFTGFEGSHYTVVENTDSVHNMVVCTLCSCYPYPLLGLPPAWYKSAPYRARAVRDPRSVLHEFGVTLPAETEIRVWDSTAEIRYLVLPQRPAGSDGLSPEALAALVTRDSMVGTGLARQPAG
ncbi:MAG: nitrile hydratase subunit alpha [Alphaproteobacteria bacterium]